jgi:hypothetical protein
MYYVFNLLSLSTNVTVEVAVGVRDARYSRTFFSIARFFNNKRTFTNQSIRSQLFPKPALCFRPSPQTMVRHPGGPGTLPTVVPRGLRCPSRANARCRTQVSRISEEIKYDGENWELGPGWRRKRPYRPLPHPHPHPFSLYGLSVRCTNIKRWCILIL